MKGYYIDITNNLLDPKHRKAIGSALWEFMWCIDKTTSITEEGIGNVLGGTPIKLEKIAEELGSAKNTISVNLGKLANAGYINLKRVPYGIIISVNKAKKRFGLKTQKERIQKTVIHGSLNENYGSLNSNIRQDKDKTNTLTTDVVKDIPPKGNIVENLLREGEHQGIQSDWQYLALELIEKLKVPKDKRSECFRIVKNYPRAHVMASLGFASDYPNVNLKWKMFLWKLNGLRKKGGEHNAVDI